MKIVKLVQSIEWWVYVLISTIIILTSLLVRETNYTSTILRTYKGRLESNDKKYGLLMNMFKVVSWNQWTLEEKKIKNGLFVTDSTNSLISLDELIANKANKVLILRFFKSSCEDCQIQEMKMIEKVMNPKHVLIIASFGTANYLDIYMHSQGISLPVYNLESTNIMLEGIDEPLNVVYSFVTDTSHKLTAVHLGKGTLPELSETYYKLIAEKFNFKKNDEN